MSERLGSPHAAVRADDAGASACGGPCGCWAAAGARAAQRSGSAARLSGVIGSVAGCRLEGERGALSDRWFREDSFLVGFFLPQKKKKAAMHVSSRLAEDEVDDATCTRFCMMQCSGCCCIALGVMLIAIGGVAPVLIDSIIDANTRRAVVLESTTEDLDHFEHWSTSQPDDAFLGEKFFFFNVTNPAAVMAGDEAMLREVGPYAVRKDKTRRLKRTPKRSPAPLACVWLTGSAPHPRVRGQCGRNRIRRVAVR